MKRVDSDLTRERGVLAVFKEEMQRTCKRDGTVWYVPLKEARERRDNAALRSGIRMQAAGSRISLFGQSSAAELQLANLEAKEARIASNSRCPTCGSTSFREKKVRT